MTEQTTAEVSPDARHRERVEAVARALWEEAVADLPGAQQWDDIGETRHARYRRLAAAAIAADPFPAEEAVRLPFAASDYDWGVEQVDHHSARVVSRGLSFDAANATAAALATQDCGPRGRGRGGRR